MKDIEHQIATLEVKLQRQQLRIGVLIISLLITSVVYMQQINRINQILEIIDHSTEILLSNTTQLTHLLEILSP